MTKVNMENARAGPQPPGAVSGAVLRLSDAQAEEVVARFERGEGADVDSDTVHLLERYFLEHGTKSNLSRRFDEALKKVVPAN